MCDLCPCIGAQGSEETRLGGPTESVVSSPLFPLPEHPARNQKQPEAQKSTHQVWIGRASGEDLLFRAWGGKGPG